MQWDRRFIWEASCEGDMSCLQEHQGVQQSMKISTIQVEDYLCLASLVELLAISMPQWQVLPSLCQQSMHLHLPLLCELLRICTECTGPPRQLIDLQESASVSGASPLNAHLLVNHEPRLPVGSSKVSHRGRSARVLPPEPLKRSV